MVYSFFVKKSDFSLSDRLGTCCILCLIFLSKLSWQGDSVLCAYSISQESDERAVVMFPLCGLFKSVFVQSCDGKIRAILDDMSELPVQGRVPSSIRVVSEGDQIQFQYAWPFLLVCV